MAGAAIAGRLANAAGDAPLVAEVWFAHAAPSERVVPRYERAFDAAVRFDQSVDALLFHEGALERSMWTSSPSLASSADTIMRTLEPDGSAFSEPLRARLRAAILNGLTTGVTLASVARELNMSPRTLQRSLRERRSSWSEELDEVRRERALVLIEDESRKMADIAVELGFGDTSAFFRAFRRWTGTTPRKRRETA